MDYFHTQRGGIHYLLYLPMLSLLIVWWIDPATPDWLVLVLCSVFLVLAYSFQTLTVADEGDALAIRYGPLPLFSKRLRYDSIRNVEVGRSSLIDGWGIHWVPGRGWTYNLWGFDCVKVQTRTTTVRVGTDDAQNLADFLRQRMA
jgi:hypothetical protein